MDENEAAGLGLDDLLDAFTDGASLLERVSEESLPLSDRASIPSMHSMHSIPSIPSKSSQKSLRSVIVADTVVTPSGSDVEEEDDDDDGDEHVHPQSSREGSEADVVISYGDARQAFKVDCLPSQLSHESVGEREKTFQNSVDSSV